MKKYDYVLMVVGLFLAMAETGPEVSLGVWGLTKLIAIMIGGYFFVKFNKEYRFL